MRRPCAANGETAAGEGFFTWPRPSKLLLVRLGGTRGTRVFEGPGENVRRLQPGARAGPVPATHAPWASRGRRACCRRKRLPVHRWRALVAALRAHEPVPAGALHAMFFTIATGSDDAALGGQDVASAAALRRLPLVRTLSLSEAVAACSARDGYLPATAQAGLLEAYGGLPVAAEALSLADAIRTAELPRPVRASRRRGRRGSGRAGRHPSADSGAHAVNFGALWPRGLWRGQAR